MVGVVAKCYEFDLTEALKVYYLAITIPFNGIFVPVITNGYIEVRYTSDWQYIWISIWFTDINIRNYVQPDR